MTRKANDDSGVSTVLGAILMFGLLIITLVTIQAKFVPVWDHDREADHMQIVQGQLSVLKSDVDRQADNRTGLPITDPVTLAAPTGFRFFTQPSPGGSLAFSPAGTGGGFTVSSPQIHVLSQNGRQIFAGSETWTQLITGGSVSSVLDIQNLRVRVLNVDATPTTYDGKSATLTLTDASSQITGAVKVTWLKGSSGFTLQYRTYIGDPSQSGNQPVSVAQDSFDQQALPPSTCPNRTPPPPETPCIYVDLLRSDLQFDQVIALTGTPFTVAISNDGLLADYAMAYTVQPAGGGSTQVGGGGRVIPNYSQNLASGSLTYVQQNNRFPGQTYILEHGGLVLVQSDGSAMVVPPEFSASVVAGQTNIRWVVPALTGSASGIGGVGQASVTLQPTGARVDMVATAPSLTFVVTSLNPTVWTSYWSTTLQQAGLAPPQFTTSSTATTATLNVYGVQSAPGSTLDDIVFTFKGGTSAVNARAAGGG
ncbi:MAG: hypothetical protein V4510_10910 [bacterium]